MSWLKETKRIAEEQDRRKKDEEMLRKLTLEAREKRICDFWDFLENQRIPELIETWRELGLDKILEDVKETAWPTDSIYEPMVVFSYKNRKPWRVYQVEYREEKIWKQFLSGRGWFRKFPVLEGRNLREVFEECMFGRYSVSEIGTPYLMGEVVAVSYGSFSGGGPYDTGVSTPSDKVEHFHLILDEERIAFGFGQFPDIEKTGEVPLAEKTDSDEMIKVLKERINIALVEKLSGK